MKERADREVGIAEGVVAVRGCGDDPALVDRQPRRAVLDRPTDAGRAVGPIDGEEPPRDDADAPPRLVRGTAISAGDRDALSRRLREVDYRIARQATLDAFEYDVRYGGVQRRIELVRLSAKSKAPECLLGIDAITTHI
jgi:hypothetical protein